MKIVSDVNVTREINSVICCASRDSKTRANFKRGKCSQTRFAMEHVDWCLEFNFAGFRREKDCVCMPEAFL